MYFFFVSCQQFLTSQWNCSQVIFLIPGNVLTPPDGTSSLNKAGSCILVTEHRKKQDCPETEKNKLKQHIHQQSHVGDFQILLCPWQPSRLTWPPQQSVPPVSLLHTGFTTALTHFTVIAGTIDCGISQAHH